jgi:hypothetical protein
MADRNRTEREFSKSDWVFLLQPYRQNSIALGKNLKLNPGIMVLNYQISEKIGNVAYELGLPEGSLVHPYLKRRLETKQ